MKCKNHRIILRKNYFFWNAVLDVTKRIAMDAELPDCIEPNIDA